MADTEYSDVKEFHTKFGVPTDENYDVPFLPDEGVLAYRADFLQEELDEFNEGAAEGNLEKALDALLDLVYVAKGTALMCGVSPSLWEELWNDVQRANMAKERAFSADDPRSKRSHSLDVVKPVGWVPPTGAAILRKHGVEL